MDLKESWIAIIKDLASEIKRPNVITWFKNTALLELKDGVLTVGLPLPVFLNWHAQNYSGLTLEAAQKHNPEIKKLVYEVDAALAQNDPRVIDILKHFPEKQSRKLPNKPEIKISNGVVSKMISNRYSLENFVVAPENRLIHAAAMTVAKFPGENYNPLFVYGGVGLGKTHILQAIGNEVLKNDPSKVVLYTTTENFVNDVIESMQARSMGRLRNKYRKVDVLIVDDIQFLANKEKTQEEFFHTFNTLFDAGKAIILSSDRTPHELTLHSERLVSRFESGMAIRIKMPDYEGRLAILRYHCQKAQVFINEKALECIAYNIDTSVRALIGVLNQAIAQYELEHISPTVQSVTDIIKIVKKEVKMVGLAKKENHPARAVTLDRLIDLVSEYYSIPKEEVIGDSRTRECLLPRQIVMYLAKSKLRISLAKIGQVLGNRNHTTVMHGISKMQTVLQNNRQLMCDVNAIAKEAGIQQ